MRLGPASCQLVPRRLQRLRPEPPPRSVPVQGRGPRPARCWPGRRRRSARSSHTSLNLKDSVPIVQAFKKKYGVEIELWRSSSEKVLQRALTEHRAGRFAVDGFELNGPEMEALYREGLLEEFYSPQIVNIPRAGDSEAPALRRRPAEFLHHRLQHEAGEAERGAELLRGPARPALGGQARHRGERGRLVRLDGQVRWARRRASTSSASWRR